MMIRVSKMTHPKCCSLKSGVTGTSRPKEPETSEGYCYKHQRAIEVATEKIDEAPAKGQVYKAPHGIC